MNTPNFKLNFVRGPFGDETSLYDVVASGKEEATVQDLINFAISQKGEWGYVDIATEDNKCRMEYSHGAVVSDSIPANIKNKVAVKIIAIGGWSRMDYIVKETN